MSHLQLVFYQKTQVVLLLANFVYMSLSGESHAAASHMDILPTFAALAGVSLPPGLVLDGASIADILLGNTTNLSTSTLDRPVVFYRGNLLYALRNIVGIFSRIYNQ